MGDVNIEDMHIHAVAVVLIPYPRPNLDMILSADYMWEALADPSLRGQQHLWEFSLDQSLK